LRIIKRFIKIRISFCFFKCFILLFWRFSILTWRLLFWKFIYFFIFKNTTNHEQVIQSKIYFILKFIQKFLVKFSCHGCFFIIYHSLYSLDSSFYLNFRFHRNCRLTWFLAYIRTSWVSHPATHIWSLFCVLIKKWTNLRINRLNLLIIFC